MLATVFAAALLLSNNSTPESDQYTVKIAEQLKHEPIPVSTSNKSAATLHDSRFGLFTNEKICMAITNAMAGIPFSSMKTSSLSDHIIVSTNPGIGSQAESYNCKQVENRFYWNNSSSVFSQSILEVEPQINMARKDILILYLFEPRDISNIVRRYNIDDFK